MPERPKGLRTWIEIDKKAIEDNYRSFRDFIPRKTKLMAVVKSNAYGHGLVDFSKEAVALGVDWLGVDSATEALALRNSGVSAPILVLGYTLPEMLEQMAKHDVSIAISSPDHIKALKEADLAKPLKVHIKVETGMNRQGFVEKDMSLVVKTLNETAQVKIEGLFTHFAMAKNPAFPEFTKKQLSVFNKWIEYLEGQGIKAVVHAAATGGALLYPDSHFDMVRIGIGLYGLWPSRETEAAVEAKIRLKPALSWKTMIGEVKEAPKGSRIGYDCTELLERNALIGICPVGYWHGYPRALSSIGHVLVRGHKARVLGRVSMDMIAIDLSDIKGKASINDEVVLLGKAAKLSVPAFEMASLIDMSPYELITRINPLIKRIYV